MQIDETRYEEMFNELLIRLSKYSKLFDENLAPVLKNACELLRIAKIEMISFANLEDEKNAKGDKKVLSSFADADENTKISKRYEAENGVISIFNMYKIKNSEEWSELEKDKIQVLSMILFTFGQRNAPANTAPIEDAKARQVEDMFPQAIKNEEFLVYYQPKVLLNSYKLTGAEALCRWKHDGKLVPPGDFIPVLENSHLICELDFYMLDHVCRDIRGWLDTNKPVVKISVNLSRRNIGTPNLLEKIVAIIDKYKVPHELLEIELLESATELNDEDLEELVNGFRTNGVSIAVDDFGTGFSSLALIRNLPWDVIKIDRSLLPEKPDERSERYTMLKHLLSMLYDMGFKCVVEGVETAEQVRMLKDNHCYVAQGFYFDRPLPKEEFETRLNALK